MESKNAVFQSLKPTCVALSQAALTLNGPRGNIQAVTERLEDLKHALESATSKRNLLDSKLAEYVFFPLSQVLKGSQKTSIRILELSLQCLAILIDQGWQQDIPPQLSAQIVILCSLLCEKEPRGLAFQVSTEELRTSAFLCLYSLFRSVKAGSQTRTLLTSEANFPQLGQTLSLVLDGIENGGSVNTQIAATHALESLVINVMDRDIQAGFLPGTVSKLTHVLTMQTNTRRNHRVLVACLSIFELLLKNTLSDIPDHRTSGNAMDSVGKDQTVSSIIDEEWLQRAAEKLRPAIASVMKLRDHSRYDVRDRVGRFCLMLLQSCRKHLANCSNIALETLLTISAAQVDGTIITELELLVNSDSGITRLLQSRLYDTLQSITTTMQGSDIDAKTMKMQQVTVAYGLLARAGSISSDIERTLASTMCNNVVVMLNEHSRVQQQGLLAPIESMDVVTLNENKTAMHFVSPLAVAKSQEAPLFEIERLVRLVCSSDLSPHFVADIARALRQSHGKTRIANFWIMLTTVQAALEQSALLEDFVDFEPERLVTHKEYLEELYSISLSILTEPVDQDADPQLQALALRTLALKAQQSGTEFRYELVDALYPVLHALATPNEALQRDSIVTLNVYAASCGYDSVKDLIIENVDYLTNAVALKLNAFDVSPQAPQVLLMMVRLAGSSLLPFLEDTLESIFAALEDYHGYPLLVELLFKVLRVMAEEGAQAPQLAVPDTKQADRVGLPSESWKPGTITGLANLLRDNIQQERVVNHVQSEELESHPTHPWGDQIGSGEQKLDVDEEDEQDQLGDKESVPPAPKTYSLLFRITDLTQHFLPSASPTLRASLLSLIRTTVPAIAQHEDSFLPLINTLWPEVVSRLDDTETFILIGAIDLIRVLCEHARDFMRSRIMKLWPRIQEIYSATSKDLAKRNLSWRPSSNPPGRSKGLILRAQSQQDVSLVQSDSIIYDDASSRLLWNSLIRCLTMIVQVVQLAPDLLEEAIEMLAPALDQVEVRDAIGEENSDALWLMQVKHGTVSKPLMPPTVDSGKLHFAGFPD